MAPSATPGIAIVTGAAGGLGVAIVKRLAEAGYEVHGWDLVDTPVPGASRMHVVDISDHEQVDAAVEALPAAPAVLVNNAAWTHFAPALEIPIDLMMRHFSVQFLGHFNCSRAVARRMIPAGGGSIVQITTVASDRAHPNHIGYGPSKAASTQMVRVLATEWGQYNIRVNALAPGTITTPSANSTLTPEMMELRRQRIPLLRWGRPEEIAEAVLFLASPASSYVTGSVLYVDGGHNAVGVMGMPPVKVGTVPRALERLKEK